MRRALSFALFSSLLLPVIAVRAEPFTIDTDTPGDFDELRPVVMSKIPQELQKAECGGWDFDQSVEGKIARVSGLPGREGDWKGWITSGMAVRKDDFLYPDSTRGLATGCAAETTTITRDVWDEAAHMRLPQEFGHPYFKDPPCLWRLKEEKWEEGYSTVDPEPLNAEDFEEIKDENDMPIPHSEPVCKDFCASLNPWQYRDCLKPVPYFDEETGEYLYDTCLEEEGGEWGCRYLCSEKPSGYEYPGCTEPPESAANLCEPGTPPAPAEGTPNSQSCAGAGCRHPQSYFRNYPAGRYVRDPVTKRRSPQDKDSGDDVASKETPASCYGFYDEFDPRARQTARKDRRCVIKADVLDMVKTQKGLGTYGQESNLPDPSPSNPQYQRNPGYDSAENLWYENLGRAFSFLNEKLFEEKYAKNLTDVYLDLDNLDRSWLTPLTPLDAKRTVASGSLVWAFDDTGTGRTVVSWWQKQQNETNAFLHHPVVRLILPAGWAFGADPDDPIIAPQPSLAPLPVTEARSERIEVQLKAGEDLLGAALGSIERSQLLHVREEPVPIVVPMGSPVEFRAIAEAWCDWYRRKAQKHTCTQEDDVPEEVAALMATLEDYATRIEDVRMLRTELARHVGKLLTLQRALTAPLHDWIRANIASVQGVLDSQRRIADILEEEWTPVQVAFNTFHTEVNRPWCMNQRFTTPVYSLLDPWLPSRKVNGSLVNGGANASAGGGSSAASTILPNVTIPPVEDIVLDFSRIIPMTGSVVIPVLHPIQVRITDLPRPPDITQEHGLTAFLPALPPIADVRGIMDQAFDSLPSAPSNPPPAPVLHLPDPLSESAISDVSDAIRRIRNTVNGMGLRYFLFWRSIGPLRPEDVSDDRYSIMTLKNNLECMEWNDSVCQHVEMDLVERVTRIGSRPDVQLREDYQAQGPPQMFPLCQPGTHPCPPMHPEGAAERVQWEYGGGNAQPDYLDKLRSDIREWSLNVPLDTGASSAPAGSAAPLPLYDAPANDLLTPFDVPGIIDLSPPRSSASSAGP